MRRSIISAFAMLMASMAYAQDINLPAPNIHQTSMSVVETLQTRHSTREYNSDPLTLQEISNVCWAACGKQRDDQHITAPTAMNRQEIRLFAFLPDGVYEYKAKTNTLEKKVDGDHRKLLAGGQNFVLDAPLSLLMVIDFDLMGSNSDGSRMMACVDAGNVSENINLYCQSVGLSTVPRGTMDSKAISQLLGFTDKQLPIMNNPVGYAKGVDRFTTKSGANVILNCIKHGSLSMQIGDKWIYVDPVTDKVQPVTDYTNMPKADIIFITHEHADHLDAKAISQLSTPSTEVIANPRSSEQLKGAIHVMKNGDEINILKMVANGMNVKAVPAYNNSADKQQFHPKGRDNGYVLTIDGLRIYIAGDTEDITEMAQLKDIDVAFLPCNLPFTMTPEQLAKAAKTIKPRVLFPYHYGQTDIQQVVKLLEGSGIDVRIRQYQ
ncbi:MAG: MBL fold metallo-hydrolase [Bacteroidaceae bacterium]|nr:MBL fold metallo-hydrolase [Bacteroidaceae bacterium]